MLRTTAPCFRGSMRRTGSHSCWTLAQIRSLAESLSAFETDMYDFLDMLCGEIDSGVITTFEQVDHAAWPS
jgi:hypothetical protein